MDIRETRAASDFSELVTGIYAVQLRRQIVPTLLADGLIALVAYGDTPPVYLVAWLVFGFVGQLSTVRLANWLAHKSTASPAKKLDIMAWVALLDGALTAIPLYWFPSLSPFECAMLSLVLVGLSIGALSTTASQRRILFAYVLPFLVPLIVLWIVVPFAGLLLQLLMAALLIVHLWVLSGLSKDMNHVLRESFSIRQERAELNQELQTALQATEAASRAKTRFLASASHDLRQPIQTLSLFATALAMRPLDERSRQIAEHMNAALRDLTHELNALLDVSKLDAGIVKVNPECCRLDLLAARMRDIFANLAQEKNLRLTIHCPEGVCTWTDRTHLERVVRNLLENAVKYTDRGEVQIVVESQDTDHVLSIIDTGRGIAPAEQARIFEEFYQIDNPERDRQRGLGLGLSIVRRLTELLGVRLQLDSTPGHGTRVSLWLPIFAAGTEPSVAKPPATAVEGIHVLVVDDEESVRLGLKMLLEQLGCTVSLGASTADAAREVTRQRPDLLLTDLRLRGDDNGIAVIRAAREQAPELPALILTGDSAPERLQQAQAAGVTVLHKPLSTPSLLHEMSKLIRA